MAVAKITYQTNVVLGGVAILKHTGSVYWIVAFACGTRISENCRVNGDDIGPEEIRSPSPFSQQQQQTCMVKKVVRPARISVRNLARGISFS
jgi:hypothetical protein